MDHLPDLENFPCPNCHAKALRPGRDGIDAICDACGQGVVFEEERDEHHKKRNYTPDRAFHHEKEGDTPKPVAHKPGLIPEKSAMPGRHGAGHVFDPVTVPSHVLETVHRDHKVKVVVMAAALVGLSALGWWFLGARQRDVAIPGVAEADKAGALMELLTARGRQEFQVVEMKQAREFLLSQAMNATRWEDLLPLVRKRDEVEPLMRGYYASQPFALPLNRRVVAQTAVANASGRFVFFRFQEETERLGVVELSADGPRLDWEFLVGYPKYQWVGFLKERPATPRELSVTLTRCYIQDEMLSEAETGQRDKLLGARIAMPGSPETLFTVIPLDSEVANWLVAMVPWEHDGGKLAVRAALSFSAAQPAQAGRVTLESLPRTSWNR